MDRRTFLKASTLFSISGTLSSCATNPVTGGKDLVLLNEDEESELGRTSHKQVMKSYSAYSNPELLLLNSNYFNTNNSLEINNFSDNYNPFINYNDNNNNYFSVSPYINQSFQIQNQNKNNHLISQTQIKSIDGECSNKIILKIENFILTFLLSLEESPENEKNSSTEISIVDLEKNAYFDYDFAYYKLPNNPEDLIFSII